MTDDPHEPRTPPARGDPDRETTRTAQTSRRGSAPPEIIGPYHLLDKLGEGGMGEVWLAQQTEPVRRKVALKIIKRGMDSSQIVARFEAERQALALMDHPAIAKVYDAGITPGGRPYFAMEHVPGVRITEHCDRHRLTNRERLELFIRVCEGVQHAHHKAVIHRDLKPSNVLVSIQDGKAVPKIIDFGVAKATAHKLSDLTVHTQLGVMIGTPAYMSPEQAEMTGQDIDTRADVYALGVLLYELLVGALPFDEREFHEAGVEAIVRKIREDEPPRPSTRLSTLGEGSTESAKRRRTELPALRRELSGDLDWITLKALEKDRTRRYSSPHEMAADIRRYLTDEPVLASPPSAAYRTRKFVKRHTWGVGVAVVGTLAVVAFGVTMAVQAGRIAAERDRAEEAQDDLVAVARFQAEMLSEMDIRGMGERLVADLQRRLEGELLSEELSEEEVARALTAFEASLARLSSTDAALRVIDEEILGKAAAAVGERFPDDPLIGAYLRHTIGKTYWRLGLYDQAEPLLEAAAEVRRRILGEGHEDTLRTKRLQGQLLIARARLDEAESLFRQIHEVYEESLGPDHPDTASVLNSLAVVCLQQGRAADAEPLLGDALAAMRRIHGREHPDTLSVMNNLANVHFEQGDLDQAEALFRETHDIRRRVLGGDHPETLAAANNLAGVYFEQERVSEAESLYRETLAAQRRVLGTDHPETISCMDSLASLHEMEGRLDEAEGLYRDVLGAQRRAFGDDHPATVATLVNMALMYHRDGRLEDAAPLYVEAIAAMRRGPGSDAYDTADVAGYLGMVYADLGRLDEAEPLYREVLEERRHRLGDEHPEVADAAYNLACLEARRGNARSALGRLGEALDAGYADAEWMAGDSDLASLRGPELDALVARARRNAADASSGE